MGHEWELGELIMIHIHRWSKQQCGTSSGMSSSHANERWLKTPELREKVVELKTRMRSAESSIKYLKSRIESSIHARGVEVDDSLESGLGDVMREFAAHVESKYTTNSFHRLFWSTSSLCTVSSTIAAFFALDSAADNL